MSYDEIWRAEYYNNVSAKDRVQDKKPSQSKPKVNDTYKKVEKITTNFEPAKTDDIVNKAYLETKMSKIEGHLSLLENDYIEKNCSAANSLWEKS